MKLIICFWAPAVMESIATTAPTPNIMPSMVSRLRSLCAKRLASPIFNSGRTCPNICLFPPRHGTHGVAIGFLLALILLGVFVGGGIGEGHHFAGLNAAREDHHGFALFEELDFARHKFSILLLNENRRPAAPLEDRLGGKVERIGDLLDHDFDIRQETRPEKDLDLGILLGGERQPGVFAILIGVGGIGTAHEALDGIHAATAAAIALTAAVTTLAATTTTTLAATTWASLTGGRPAAVAATLAAAAALPATHLGHELLTFFGAGVLHGFAHFLAIGIGHGAASTLAAAIAATSAAGVASGHTAA